MENELPRKGKKVGIGRKLSKEQEVEIFKLITQRRPFQLGFKKLSKNKKLFLWSRELVTQLIQQKFEVKLSDDGLVNYLTRWDFPKLNRKDSKHEQCDNVIRTWLDLNLEALIARSKDEYLQIYWMGDIKLIGLETVEKGRSKRLTLIPVIENQGRMHWITVQGTFNDERQVQFLKSLRDQASRKIFLIRRTSTHFKSKLVKDWLNVNKTG